MIHRACVYVVSFATLAGLGCAPSSKPSSTASPGRFRVVTWNVHGCENGLDGVVAELRRLDANVICLQEVEIGTRHTDGADQAALIARGLGMSVYAAGSPFANAGEQRMAILTRQAIAERQTLDAGTGRIYGVMAQVACGGRAVRVASLHLTSTHRVDAQHALKTTQARWVEANDLVRRLRQASGDAIVAGDFNAGPGMPAHDAISRELPAPAEVPPTFPSDRPTMAIDHVLSKGGMRLTRYEAFRQRRRTIDQWSRNSHGGRPPRVRAPRPDGRMLVQPRRGDGM